MSITRRELLQKSGDHGIGLVVLGVDRPVCADTVRARAVTVADRVR